MTTLKNKRRQIKLPKTMPPSDPQETAALLDLLFEATKSNSSHCCRLLGISRPTWKRWMTNTPTEWYWPMVIRIAIKHTLATVIAQRRMTSKAHQERLREKLNAIPGGRDFEEEIANLAYDIQAAQTHLRDILTPRGRWWSQIKSAAYSGGFSKQTLRKAAKAVGVVQKQEGYGADKDSYWRLPNEDDD